MAGSIHGEDSQDQPVHNNRPVIVGSKFQATAPAVADGDAVALLVDTAGRVIIVGPAAHDAAEVGNPVKIGGVYRTSIPAVAAGDVVDFLMTAEGRSHAVPWIPAASEVKTVRLTTGATSTTRSTELTPTSGKKVRVISLDLITDSATATNFEVYFGTGTNITTNAGSEIAECRLDTDIVMNFTKSWPDGGGPVGAADEVVSIRTGTDIGTGGFGILTYREE